jgi:hypothetical protein
MRAPFQRSSAIQDPPRVCRTPKPPVIPPSLITIHLVEWILPTMPWASATRVTFTPFNPALPNGDEVGYDAFPKPAQSLLLNGFNGQQDIKIFRCSALIGETAWFNALFTDGTSSPGYYVVPPKP